VFYNFHIWRFSSIVQEIGVTRTQTCLRWNENQGLAPWARTRAEPAPGASWVPPRRLCPPSTPSAGPTSPVATQRPYPLRVLRRHALARGAPPPPPCLLAPRTARHRPSLAAQAKVVTSKARSLPHLLMRHNTSKEPCPPTDAARLPSSAMGAPPPSSLAHAVSCPPELTHTTSRPC
jgi:hypothetical protein